MSTDSTVIISFIATMMFIGISGAVIMLVGRSVAIEPYRKTTAYFSIGFFCSTLLASCFIYLTKATNGWLSTLCFTVSNTFVLIGLYFLLHGISNRTNRKPIKKRYIVIHIIVFMVVGLTLSDDLMNGIYDHASSIFVAFNYIGINVMMLPYVKLRPKVKASMGEYTMIGVLCVSALIFSYYPFARIYTDTFLEYITFRAPIQTLQIHLWVLGLLVLLLSDMVIGFRKQAFTDHMTNLYNRFYFTQEIETALQKKDASEHALILCDIDFFKSINDTYGHTTGDKVIEYFAEILKKTIRHDDIAARLGGEEFAIYLPNTTKEIAQQLAEDIRSNCNPIDAVNQADKVQFTVSFGVVEINPKDTLNDALKYADKALYTAKNKGRNRVELYTQPQSV